MPRGRHVGRRRGSARVHRAKKGEETSLEPAKLGRTLKNPYKSVFFVFSWLNYEEVHILSRVHFFTSSYAACSSSDARVVYTGGVRYEYLGTTKCWLVLNLVFIPWDNFSEKLWRKPDLVRAWRASYRWSCRRGGRPWGVQRRGIWAVELL